MLADELTEFSYDAEIAGLYKVMYNTATGFRICLDGYSHKLPVLLERLLTKIAQPVLEESVFELQRELQRKEYANFFRGQGGTFNEL